MAQHLSTPVILLTIKYLLNIANNAKLYLVRRQPHARCHVDGSGDDVLSRVSLYTYRNQTNRTLLIS